MRAARQPDPILGFHNSDLSKASERLLRGGTYRDLSTIIVTPTRDHRRSLSPRWVAGMQGLMRPMNQKCIGPLFIAGHEVAEAYNAAVQAILDNPELSRWRYILTFEDDVIPPPDGLLKLYESLEGGVCTCGKDCKPDERGRVKCGVKLDCVQGLYWTKGYEGQPMIYGDPETMPKNFVPQQVKPGTVQKCNGLGMGFNLFRVSMFKDKSLRKPWFKTEQTWEEGKGAKGFTQDLYFFDDAGSKGFKFACDTRVLCGHYDDGEDKVW